MYAFDRPQYLDTSLTADCAPSHSKASLWKLNSSLLELPDVKVKIKELIANYWKAATIQNYLCTNWELLKFEIVVLFKESWSNLSHKQKSS